MPTLRYLEKFENLAATLSYTFHLRNYEWVSEQQLKTPVAAVAGANYVHDFLGTSPSPKNVSVERVRCLVKKATFAELETEIDNARAYCYRIGLGKLYVLNTDGTRRWAYGRLESMPSVTVASPQGFFSPFIFQFIRVSDWFGTTATTGTRVATVTPDTFTINNPGSAAVDFAVIRFRANTAAGFTNPVLANLTNGYSISSTRDSASVDSELKIDCERMEVKFSSDNGVNYTDDWALATIAAIQVGLMRFEPGDNTMRYTDGGTPNLNIEWSFNAPYH